jgi:hypothetical protein
MELERIAIEGTVDCRNPAGQHLTVLQWRRQVAERAAASPARWHSKGPAIFTLYDASAVIQVSGSALQVVATGMRLDVMNQGEFVGPCAAAGMPAPRDTQVAA